MGWTELKKYAFGPLKLKPDEFWSLTLIELADLLEGYIEEERRKGEDLYYLAAWVTSHIMNSSGNYKKVITPELLLNKPTDNTPMKMSAEERDKAIQELLEKFNKTKDATAL